MSLWDMRRFKTRRAPETTMSLCGNNAMGAGSQAGSNNVALGFQALF